MHYGKNPLNTYLRFTDPHPPNYGVVAVDQEKFNFIWLNYPDIDTKGLLSVPPDAIDGVCKYMDKLTRAALQRQPKDFMRYWNKLDTGEGLLGLVEAVDPNYRVTMAAQAKEAQARLFKVVKEGNVFHVSFGNPAYV